MSTGMESAIETATLLSLELDLAYFLHSASFPIKEDLVFI